MVVCLYVFVAVVVVVGCWLAWLVYVARFAHSHPGRHEQKRPMMPPSFPRLVSVGLSRSPLGESGKRGEASMSSNLDCTLLAVPAFAGLAVDCTPLAVPAFAGLAVCGVADTPLAVPAFAGVARFTSACRGSAGPLSPSRSSGRSRFSSSAWRDSSLHTRPTPASE